MLAADACVDLHPLDPLTDEREWKQHQKTVPRIVER